MQALYELRSQQKDALLVRAGIDGVLEEVSIGAGQQINTGTILARVTNSARLMARVHIPEAQFSHIDFNQPATITVQSHDYAARVAHIDPNVQSGTISIDLRFSGQQRAKLAPIFLPAGPSTPRGFLTPLSSSGLCKRTPMRYSPFIVSLPTGKKPSACRLR
jgi:multidrug efflux pump subunit AcrA (membrane-fusion protein)